MLSKYHVHRTCISRCIRRREDTPREKEREGERERESEKTVAGLRGGKREKGGPTRLRMGDLRDSQANLVDRALEKGKGRRKGQKKQSRREKRKSISSRIDYHGGRESR
jgi:hypothetical protein